MITMPLDTILVPEYRVDEAKLLEILTAMQVPCRSNFNGIFTDKARLQAIHAQLADSPFTNVFNGMNCDVYTKYRTKNFADKDVLLISTHVDTVNSIHKLFAIRDDERRLLSGTFDNTITNAACVYLMAQMDLPESVVFTFTADEETGRCRGAKRALQFLLDNGADAGRVSILALDVTYEGFREHCGFTLENPSRPDSVSTLAEFANQSGMSYVFASPNQSFPDNVPHELRSKERSWYDEGTAYEEFGRAAGLRESISLCMPVYSNPGCNGMHSDEGVLAWTDSFLAYTSVLGAYAKEYLNEREHLYVQLSYSENLRDEGEPER